MKFFIIFNLTWLLSMPFTVLGAPRSYRTPLITPADSSIKFFIPYTFGTHEGEARMFSGKISLDLIDPAQSNGEFSVPISAMTTAKPQRDCHMREALGLDYGDSDFPEVHVCNEDDELPTAGKNAVKYPMIKLKVKSIKSLGPEKSVSLEKESTIEVEGEWIIHGKSYQWVFPLRLSLEGEKLRVRGEVPFSLKNHDVIVKANRVLFIEIGVKDNAKVQFDLVLEPNGV